MIFVWVITLSGIISPSTMYGMGSIPQDAIKRTAEKLTTGTHCMNSKSIPSDVLQYIYVASTARLTPVPTHDSENNN